MMFASFGELLKIRPFKPVMFAVKTSAESDFKFERSIVSRFGMLLKTPDSLLARKSRFMFAMFGRTISPAAAFCVFLVAAVAGAIETLLKAVL